MPVHAMRIDPRDLLEQRDEIDRLISEAEGDNTLARRRVVERLTLRREEIQRRLSTLREVDTRPRMASPRVRIAVLYKVAAAADAFLYGDDDDDSVGDALEEALENLERVSPGWKNHKPKRDDSRGRDS